MGFGCAPCSFGSSVHALIVGTGEPCLESALAPDVAATVAKLWEQATL